MKKKTIKKLAYVGTGAVLSLLAVGSYTTFFAASTSANPDYICVKDVDRSCVIDTANCGEWKTNGERVCPWVKTTQVAYHLRRTTCETGYTRIDQGTNSGGVGWRLDSDYTYNSESCSITQVDKVAPVGITE